MKTYVYDGVEVKPTGREAIRHRSRGGKSVDEKLIEIVSIDPAMGINKWVSIDALFEITEKK